eukprot:TRINITY_DN17189_c0_g1_i2.p1 TRINITY_DN17189_c0_g1~~TRINITY_DN17189_c0_g1_i2.p1  ORF type:complete len:240 (-),score=10.27 TRINITY_DN17189_c0_g1_i2:191-865(-)
MDELTPSEEWRFRTANYVWGLSYCLAYLIYYCFSSVVTPEFPASFSCIIRCGTTKYVYCSLKAVGWVLFGDVVMRRGHRSTKLIALKAFCIECILVLVLNGPDQSAALTRAHKVFGLIFTIDHCILCTLICSGWFYKRLLYASCSFMMISMLLRRRLFIQAGASDIAGKNETVARELLVTLRADLMPALWKVEVGFMAAQVASFLAGGLATTSHINVIERKRNL